MTKPVAVPAAIRAMAERQHQAATDAEVKLRSEGWRPGPARERLALAYAWAELVYAFGGGDPDELQSERDGRMAEFDSVHRVSWYAHSAQIDDGLRTIIRPTGYIELWCSCGWRVDGVREGEADQVLDQHERLNRESSSDAQ